MAEEAYSKNAEHILESIDILSHQRFYIPALIMIYCGIDILASLDTDQSKSNNHSVKNNFVRWVNKYMLPNEHLNCTALDLYAARCAVVHTFGVGSRWSEKGSAKRLIYAFGDSSSKELQAVIDAHGVPEDVAVHFDDIVEAFKQAVMEFKKAILTDKDLKARVTANSNQFFAEISYGHGLNFLDIRILIN